MKSGYLLVGLLVTTIAAAQIRTPPPAALATPSEGKNVSPAAHVGDAIAVDPQFELLRKQIALLKQQQSEQHNEIARLQTCVRELIKASRSNRGIGQSGGSLNSAPGTFAGASAIGAPMNGSPGLQKPAAVGKPLNDNNGMSDHVATLAPGPARANLASCD